MNKPPFRADHVGSLLRPPALLEARQKKRAGKIDDAAFREVQQRCVRESGKHVANGAGDRDRYADARRSDPQSFRIPACAVMPLDYE